MASNTPNTGPNTKPRRKIPWITTIVFSKLFCVDLIASQLKAFGEEVRRRRLALGITLAAFARVTGLTQNYLGSVELGKRDPSLSTLEAISRGLGVQAGDLLGGIRKLSASSLEAAALYDASPAEVRAAVSEILRAVPPRKRR